MIKIALFCFVAPLCAVLPPFYESVREIQALLSDSRLHERLGSAETIEGIARTEMGYLIETGNYRLEVEMEYLPAGRPGPAKFRFDFHEPVAK
ncbi:MAG: hypothetical protein A3E80_06725 [Chlamydiae bacterium RIFCSPHIGHO2_12_FULL_49_9]|nr:MAG: hypothetical protein A3E80_06725 [Chlamydiae bacterium RIFCSPHIGHO2_12_FULL_49_9]